jgi:hypothetical protein
LTFIEQFRGDLFVELVVEPGAEAADLVALFRVAGHELGGGNSLFQIFADRLAFRHHAVVPAQDRHLARRVAAQEIGRGLPVPLFDQFNLKPLLGKGQTDLAAEGGEGEVIEADHCAYAPRRTM